MSRGKKVIICIYCQKMLYGGGINRLKKHLAGKQGEVASCKKVPSDVRFQMEGLLKDVEHKVKKVGSSVNILDDDDDDEEEEIQLQSKEKLQSKGKRKASSQVHHFFTKVRETSCKGKQDLVRISDQLAKGQEFEQKAEKKLNGWGFFGFKYQDAGHLYEKAANHYKLAKSWDQAGSVYVKLAGCHLKMDIKHAAADAYADAAHSYKKTNTKECIANLEKASSLFMEIGRLSMSAKYCEEIAKLYEQEQNLDQAISYYDNAADLFHAEELTTCANQCKQKIAQFSAQLEQYQKAIEIYEEIARQSLNDDFLKYRVREHLLNAGICQLCKADIVAITNALERYQELAPTFSGTREYQLLADLAAAVDEEDVAKFTDVVMEFDCMTKLDEWKTTLLLRVKLLLKAKEEEDDDDLT